MSLKSHFPPEKLFTGFTPIEHSKDKIFKPPLYYYILMDTIENFIGNDNAKEAIVNWLNYHFHSTATVKCKKCGFPVMFKGDVEYVNCPKCSSIVSIDIKKYMFLYGSSGNGKSYLPKLLANSFEVELFKITPLDIQSTADLNEIIKSINIGTLSGKKRKIVLIDDIDEYNNRYKMGLQNRINIKIPCYLHF